MADFGKSMTRDKALAGFGNVPWGEYVRNRAFLTQDEVNVLQRTEEASLDIALGDQETSRRLVMVLQKVVANINDAGAQRYALTRIDDVLSGKSDLDGGAEVASSRALKERARLFQDTSGLVDVPILLRVLRTEGPDPYCKGCAAMSLARLLLESQTSPVEPLVAWICDQLASSSPTRNAEVLATAVKSLTILLRREDARAVFGAHGGVGYLTKLLKSSSGAQGGGTPNSQLLYELTFSMWTLSFTAGAKPLFVAANAVSALVDQVTAAPREKVVRISLATLRNLVTLDLTATQAENDDADRATAAAVTNLLIGLGLPKTLANMLERSWADKDVASDVEEVYGVLMANYRELSTFERWQTEIATKQLKWGSKLVHCDKFWRENAKGLEKGDFGNLKALIALLDSMDAETVAVACYDLGEFVRFYPNGKALVKNLGGKDQVLKLIEHPNAEVQREALQCMSKIMVNQWEFMR